LILTFFISYNICKNTNCTFCLRFLRKLQLS